MSSVITNFVTVRQTPGDVLPPAAYRSVVEMITGILNDYDYASFGATYQSFLAHLVDYNDPHHASQGSFRDEIFAKIYNIYALMTRYPLSQVDFENTIAPSVGLFELLRRILLNRQLYESISLSDGTVPATVTVTLGGDYGGAPGPVTLNFGSVLADEAAFLFQAWKVVNPVSAVFSADNLAPPKPNRVCAFHTSMTAPFFSLLDAGAGYTVALDLDKVALTLELSWTALPEADFTLAAFHNDTTDLTVVLVANNTLQVRQGGVTIITGIDARAQRCSLDISTNGAITITTVRSNVVTTGSATLSAAFLPKTLDVPVLGHYQPPLAGIDSLTLYRSSSR
jgi:hypothetical protein